MNVTEEALAAICRLAGDQGAQAVSVRAVRDATTLDANELRTALAALELSGMLLQVQSTDADTATVQLTARGMAWSRETDHNG